MKIGKKGFLLGEYTLKIIIAVISLSLLFYLLFMIYSSSQDNKDLKLAEASLDSIVEKMEIAKLGEVQSEVLLNPEKWRLFYYPGEDEKPEVCDTDCLCLCNTGKLLTCGLNNQICKCENYGVCKNIESEVELDKIVLPSDIEISYNENKIEITKK